MMAILHHDVKKNLVIGFHCLPFHELKKNLNICFVNCLSEMTR